MPFTLLSACCWLIRSYIHAAFYTRCWVGLGRQKVPYEVLVMLLLLRPVDDSCLK